MRKYLLFFMVSFNVSMVLVAINPYAGFSRQWWEFAALTSGIIGYAASFFHKPIMKFFNGRA